MRLFGISFLALMLFATVSAVSSPVRAAIPDKRVCVQNDKGQPLLYKGQGLWVNHNNATGTKWNKQAGADGCAVFPDGDAYEYDDNKSIDGNFDGSPDRKELEINGGNGDLGCASGPFGFQVVMPKEWEALWECQTVGSVNGPFPCCRSSQERDDPELRPAGGCNDCKVHNPGYEGQYQEIACYCDRSAHNNLPDYQCPICFHNDGATVNVVLQCKSKKSTQSKQLDSPAAEQFSIKESQGVACLTTEVCAKKEDGSTNCSAVPEQGQLKHRVRLSNVKDMQQTLTKRDPAKPVYIVECVMNGTNEADANYLCTTGDGGIDQQLFGQNNLAQLAPYGYSAKIFNESGANTVGSIPIKQPLTDPSVILDLYEWETTTTKPISSVFAVVYDELSTTAISSTDIAAQKQSQLSFADACTLVIDPYGRAFDTKTLEPLSDTQVHLRDAEGKSIASQTTKADGVFSFYTKPGTYTAEASKPGYRYPASMVMNPQADDLYTNYYRGEQIDVQNELVYMDIPMDPEDAAASREFARTNAPQIMEHFQSLDAEQGVYRIQGRVSHPKAVVVAYGHVPHPTKNGEYVRSRALGRANADNYGRFDLTFPTNKLLSRETVGELEVVKNQKYFIGSSKTSIPLNPLLKDIRGYAYDASGNVIPGAKVAVNVPFSTKALVEILADERGYFEIDGSSLPPVPYKLQFTSLSGATDVVDTRTFLAMNAKRDPFTYIAANTQSFVDNVLGVSDDTAAEEPFRKAEQDSPNPSLLVLFIVVIGSAIPLYRLYSKKDVKSKRK